MSTARPTRGPRGGAADTRADILTAAATVFTRDGFERGSFRAIAREAGVDPALVRHYFDSKAQLFLAALRPLSPDEVAATPLFDGPADRAGERLVRVFATVWDDPARGPRLRAILLGASASPAVAQELRGLLLGEVLPRVVAPGARDHLELRAAACAAQLMGLAMARHVLGFEPLASADVDTLAAVIGPTLQRYLDGELGIA